MFLERLREADCQNLRPANVPPADFLYRCRRGSKTLKRHPNPLALLGIKITPYAGGKLDPAQYRVHIQVDTNRTIGTRLGHLPASNPPEKALELRSKGILVRPLH